MQQKNMVAVSYCFHIVIFFKKSTKTVLALKFFYAIPAGGSDLYFF